jgi:hypothetical protein
MKDTITYVGFDAHKDNISVDINDEGTGNFA